MSPLDGRNVEKYVRGKNPALDALIGVDEDVYIVNRERGRVPIGVPSSVTNKPKWAVDRYRELYEECLGFLPL